MKRFVGERRAVAAAVLAFYGFIYLLLVMLEPMPGWGRAFGAMSALYGVGFLGIVAGYFWARWYAIGLGLSWVISAIVGMWQVGPEPVLVFFGATHGAIALVLWGEAMATPFDGREEWRSRFHMDEYAVHRLGKSVIRIGISLPFMLMYALAPREGMGVEGTLLAVGVLGLAGAGTWALLRLRTWGLAAVAGAAGLLAVAASQGGVAASGGGAVDLGTTAGIGAAMLAAATIPFAKPVARFLRA